MRFTLKILAILATASLLAACTATPVPTIDVAPTLDAVRTEAALTAAAEFASLPTETPLPATATLAPTATELPTATAVPSNTSVPAINTPPPTNVPVVNTPAATSTNSAYNCSITASLPAWGGSFPVGADFDGRWTVKNTGTSSWAAAEYDYRYQSGDKMHVGADVYDLPGDIDPGESVEIIVDMKAPTTAGGHTTNWSISRGTSSICSLPVYIIVK